MTDTPIQKVISASDIEIDQSKLHTSINRFAEKNGAYYSQAFMKIHEKTSIFSISFNLWACLLGPFWSASRALWGMFWSFLILEIVAWCKLDKGYGEILALNF